MRHDQILSKYFNYLGFVSFLCVSLFLPSAQINAGGLDPSNPEYPGDDNDKSESPAQRSGYDAGQRSTDSGKGYGQRDSQYTYDMNAASSAEEAAMLVSCGWRVRPYGPPLQNYRVSERWEWKRTNPQWRYAFEAKYDRYKSYSNPLCELYMMQRLQMRLGKSAVKDRCESIRTEFYRSQHNLESSGGSGNSFSALDTLFNFRSGDNAADICVDPDPHETFACFTLDFQGHLENNSLQKTAAKQLAGLCRGQGADMRARLSADQWNSMGDIYGGAACGPAGGMVVIQNQNKWYDTVANTLLGIVKVGAPVAALAYGSYLHNKVARDAVEANRQLGFPSMVNAGAQGGGVGYGYGAGGGMCGGGIHAGYGHMGPGWGSGNCLGGQVGYGYGNVFQGPGGVGCVYGGGGCGGYYGGGHAIGGVHGGHGGACPYGACYGNGGYIVGGGQVAGGYCGQPPYSPHYYGCGQSDYYPGGGYYQGGGQAPYYGGGGAGGLPGPYGTRNSPNGWYPPGGGYNPFGYNGMYGQPQYWGASSGQQHMAMHGQFYNSYQAAMARSARRANQNSKLGRDLQKDQLDLTDNQYGAYYGYQLAASRAQSPTYGYYAAAQSPGVYYGGGGHGGSGAYLSGQGAYYGNAVPAPSYYPPYSSGAGNNFQFSLGGSYNSHR